MKSMFERGMQLTLCSGIALLLFCREALLIEETAPPIAAPQHRPQMASGLLQKRGRVEASARNLCAAPIAQDFAGLRAGGGFLPARSLWLPQAECLAFPTVAGPPHASPVVPVLVTSELHTRRSGNTL